MQEFIFSNKKVEPKDHDIKQYTILGSQDFIDNEGNPVIEASSDKVFAKSIQSDNGTKYYVKIGTYGKIYNPIGLFSEGRHTRFIAKIGKKEYDFKEVNQKVFSLYVNFLRTKNLAWLNNAERELS